MRTIQTGAGAPSPAVTALAGELQARFPDPLAMLTGLVLSDRGSDRPVEIDFIAITEEAIVAGSDTARGPQATPPGQAAAIIAHHLAGEASTVPPISAIWLGPARPEGQVDETPTLADASAVQRYLLRAASTDAPDSLFDPQAMADWLLQKAEGNERKDEATVAPAPRRTVPRSNRPAPPAPKRPARASQPTWLHRVRGLAQVVRRMPSQVDERIQEAMIHPPILPRHVEPVRPPLVTEALKKAMLAPENILEDAMYAKIVPNDYLVELNDQIFERFFAPLERDLIEQWSQVLVTHLNDTAIRLQPQRYRAGGPVRIRLQPAPPSELAEDRFRIHAWVRPDVAPAALATRRARLELLGGTQQWPLRDGVTTIGRDPDCDVHLDLPIVHEKPLISGRQAHILGSEKGFTVLDGAPGGRASRNGTYVNGRRVRPGGVPLQDGDHIILAALDPNDPRPDTEGVVTLIFHVDQPSAISRQPSASGS